MIKKFTGKTVEAALAKGLKAMNLNRDQVNLKIISQAAKVFWGFGQKFAIIELEPISAQPTVQSENTEPEKKLQQNNLPDEKAAVDSLKDDQLVEKLGQYLADVTEAMGIKTHIEVTQEDKLVTYCFKTGQVGQLIGKHGRTLDALQTIAEAFLAVQKNRKLQVILETSNYRQEQKAALQHLALKKAALAVKLQHPVNCPAMQAFERKIIHQTLVARGSVRTLSAGKEPHRFVRIYPNNK
mgnify:CR=1 FL=1